MPSCLNILLILKQKSKRRNLNMKSQKDLSNSTMGKMSIKKPLFRESRGATHMVVMHHRQPSDAVAQKARCKRMRVIMGEKSPLQSVRAWTRRWPGGTHENPKAIIP